MAEPPVIELALAVGFERLSGLTIVDMAELFGRFKPEYPILQQLAEAPPMVMSAFQASVFQIPGFQMGGFPGLQVAAESSPRLWFISEDSHHLVQFQRDRICQNWRRSAPGAESGSYPGFESISERFWASFGRLQNWLDEKGFGFRKPNMGQVSYVNVIAVSTDRGPRRISEVFRTYTPARKANVNGFLMRWEEKISPDYDGQISCTIAAVLSAGGEPAMQFNIDANFALPIGDFTEAARRFDVAHRYALQLFADNLHNEFVNEAKR